MVQVSSHFHFYRTSSTMEAIAEGMAKISINNPDMKVTVDDLRRIVKHLEDQNIASLTIADAVHLLIQESKLSAVSPSFSGSHEGKKAKSQANGHATPPASPHFTFQSPSKPFTPFVFKASVGHDAADSTEPAQAVRESKSLSGFFEAARTSIPTDLDAAAPDRQADKSGPSASVYSEMTKEWAARTARDKEAKETQQAEGGWFWASQPSSAVPSEGSKPASLFADIAPAPLFNIGAAASKRSKPKAQETTLPVPSASVFSAADTAGPDAFFKSFTIGASDVLHSLQSSAADPAAAPSSNSNADLDEEMSMDPAYPTPSDEPEVSPAQKPAAANVNLDSSFADAALPDTAPSATFVEETLSRDFTKISFQMGASDDNKSTKKTKPRRKVAVAASPQRSADASPSDPGFAFPAPENHTEGAEQTAPTTPRRPAGDSSWWFQGQAPRTPRTPRSKAAAPDEKSARTPSKIPDEQVNDGDQNLLSLAELYSKQGKELYGIGLYDRALDAYSKCLNLAPKTWPPRATILGNRAAVYFMLHGYIETVNDCDDALKMDNGLVKLLVRKAKALIRLGLFNDADASFSRVLEYSSIDLLSPELLRAMDDEERALYQQTIDSAKQEAKSGLREVKRLRDAVSQLIGAEGRMDFAEILKIADEILARSPHHRASQLAKANVLCELSRYEEAKTFMEELTRSAAANVQALHAHAQAKQPFPSTVALAWTEESSGGMTVDLRAILAAMLGMGSELAHTYMLSLKNIKCSRNYCTEVMNMVSTLLSTLDTALSAEDKIDAWSWVDMEATKLKELISLKTTADLQFKAKNFRGALQSYSSALKVDPFARRWAAILFSNRAASNMSIGMFADAISDCHNSISKDADYSRAYLRRARALRALNKVNDSIRDYRRYLCTDPVPSDFNEAQAELDELVASTADSSRGRPSVGKANENNRNHNNAAGPGPKKPLYTDRTKVSKPHRTSAVVNADLIIVMQPPSRGASGSFDDDIFAQFQRQQSRGSSYPQAEKQQSPRPNSSRGNQHESSGRRSWKSYFDPADLMSSDDDTPPPTSGPAPTKQRSHSTTAAGAGFTSTVGLFSLKESDHYTILGVDTVANERDIKMSYRKLALQFHPDKNKDPDAEERFKMVSLAYTVLSDKVTDPIQCMLAEDRSDQPFAANSS